MHMAPCKKARMQRQGLLVPDLALAVKHNIQMHAWLQRLTGLMLQNLLMSLGGLKFIGCVSGVADSSSRQNLMVLSASQVSMRVPVWSKPSAKMPASLSRDPGCTIVLAAWKLLPLFQSQNLHRQGTANEAVCTYEHGACRLMHA